MKKIILFINTAAHIPTIFAVVELLKRSGRYRPVILFARPDIYRVAQERVDLSDCDSYVDSRNGFVEIKKSDTSEDGLPSWGGEVRGPGLKFLVRKWASSCLLSLSKRLTYCFSVANYVSMCLRLGRLDCIKYVFFKNVRSNRIKSDAIKNILLSIFHEKMKKDYGGFSKKHFLECRNGMFYGIYKLRRYSYHVSVLMDDLKPVLLILPEENLLYNHCYVVKVAHDKNIKCCVVPFTVANQKEWLEAFFDVPEFQDNFGWNSLFITAYPKWSVLHKGRRLVLPGLHIFTSEYLECAPKIPWLINSGIADVIAVESEFMMRFYKKSGIEESRMRLTGATSDDRLYEVLRNREDQRLGIKNKLSASVVDGGIFLIALPPDQFSLFSDNKTEFMNHQELIDYMLSVVISEKLKDDIVIVNLHPRTSISEISLPACEGLYVVNDPIESLIPLSDLFIAVSSATIRQAISCGVRVINYNAYGYDYDEYREVESVLEVREKEEYRVAVRGCVEGSAKLSQVSNKHDGLIDGRSGERLLNLFDSLAV